MRKFNYELCIKNYALCIKNYALCTVLLFASCEYKDLKFVPVLQNLQVTFLWHEVPDARPRGMVMHVFADGTSPVVIPFDDAHGGTTSLQCEDFHLVAHNDGTALQTRGTTYDDFEIYAISRDLALFAPMFSRTSAVPRAPTTESETSIDQPDSLQTDAIPLFTVRPGVVNEAVFTMHSANQFITVEIDSVENIGWASDFTATISGMGGSYLPARRQCSDTNCIIPFVMDITGPESIRGTACTFGHCPNDGNLHTHMLTVYCMMKNGVAYYYVIDITKEMHQGDRWRDQHITIRIDGLPIPKPITNGSGLRPDVTEWNEVHIGIDLDK